MKDNMAKDYKQMRMVSLAMLIPLYFVSGPIAGYMLGYFLEKYFNISYWWKTSCVLVGFLAGVRQAYLVFKDLKDET